MKKIAHINYMKILACMSLKMVTHNCTLNGKFPECLHYNLKHPTASQGLCPHLLRRPPHIPSSEGAGLLLPLDHADSSPPGSHRPGFLPVCLLLIHLSGQTSHPQRSLSWPPVYVYASLYYFIFILRIIAILFFM